MRSKRLPSARSRQPEEDTCSARNNRMFVDHSLPMRCHACTDATAPNGIPKCVAQYAVPSCKNMIFANSRSPDSDTVANVMITM